MGAWERAKQEATKQKHFLFPSDIVQVHKSKQGVPRMEGQLDFKYSLHFHSKKRTGSHLVCVLKLDQL